jgi:DNA-binding helix-hairpin-helix protein with protein kinase domain
VPLPESVANNILKVVLKVILTCVALLVFASSPAAWFVIILVAYGAWQLVGTIGEGERNSELNKRRDACNIAQQSYNQILGRVRQGSFPEEFATKKQELAKLCEEYKNLPEREKTEIAKLHASAEARQRHDFLDKIFIDTATIPGIGLTKKAALRSFGIETAADVNWKSVMAVKGFGAVLTSAVVDWQKGLERRFVFNPSQSITETDRLRVRSVIISRKNEIENALSGGISELQKIRQDALNKYEELNAEMQKASKNLAQKQADLYPQ